MRDIEEDQLQGQALTLVALVVQEALDIAQSSLSKENRGESSLGEKE